MDAGRHSRSPLKETVVVGSLTWERLSLRRGSINQTPIHDQDSPRRHITWTPKIAECETGILGISARRESHKVTLWFVDFG